jgi:FkbM family methyltransferase
MAVFLSSLKKSGHLENIHITVCIVGSRKLASQDDYGSQGWEIFAPNLTIYGFDADPEACKQANSQLQARQIDWTEQHIPKALWKKEGKSTLYVTQYPGCSSLYPPSEYYIEKFAGNSPLIKLAYTQEVETTTLDAFCQSTAITEIDFIQLDVQGAELAILEGASQILTQSLLGIITEVEFTEIYTKQPLFGDLDVYLREQGLTLFDINALHRDLRRMPITSAQHQGSLIWGDAFYFRDLLKTDSNLQHRTPEKLFKLACIADVLNFSDYALDILIHLTEKYGQDEKYNFVSNIIESLAYIPGLVNEVGKLSALPIFEQILKYSRTDNFEDTFTQAELQKQGYELLLLGEYEQAIGVYERAIELYPEVKSNYWYLGLLLLIKGDVVEAQATWFLAISESENNEIAVYSAELIEVLKAEAERRDVIGDNVTAAIIRENLQEIDPQSYTDSLQRIQYSYLGEEVVIEKYINELNLEHRYCVDIAASDGVTMSNTLFLYQQGWSGLAVECDSKKFAALATHYQDFPNVILSKSMVTPDNVISLLKAYQVPEKFGLLNLDIDGYEYFVLEKILSEFRPAMICTEINESIPPPLKFTVKWNPGHFWAGDRFFGQSICQLNLLCEKYDYALVELHYNNAFLIPQEISPHPSLTPEEAYRKGYIDRTDRKQKFPWNADIEEIHSLSPEAALAYVSTYFAKYVGKFDCSL